MIVYCPFNDSRYDISPYPFGNSVCSGLTTSTISKPLPGLRSIAADESTDITPFSSTLIPSPIITPPISVSVAGLTLIVVI